MTEGSSARLRQSNLAAWFLAKVWLRLGKYDEAKQLALRSAHTMFEAQHSDPTPWEKLLREVWGINSDGININESGVLDPHDTADQVLDDYDHDDTTW